MRGCAAPSGGACANAFGASRSVAASGEDNIYSVICCSECLVGEAARAIFENNCRPIDIVRQSVERVVIDTCVGKEVGTERVIAHLREVGDDVGCACGDVDGFAGRTCCQPDELSFAKSRCEEFPTARPHAADVRTGIRYSFVEANASDVSIAIRTNLHPQFNWLIVGVGRIGRLNRGSPAIRR